MGSFYVIIELISKVKWKTHRCSEPTLLYAHACIIPVSGSFSGHVYGTFGICLS